MKDAAENELQNASFASNVNDNSFNEAESTAYKLKLYLIGDAKGIFQTLGRSGYDSSYCMFCKCRPKTWKEKHAITSGNHSSTCVIAEKWSVNAINEVALEQNQKDASGMSYVSVGVRTFPLFKFTPIDRVLPPLLHLLLGLGNDIYSKFKEWVSIRIERKSNELIEAQNMSFLTEVRCDEALLLHDDYKKEVQGLVQKRIEILAKLKERGRSRESKNILKEEKSAIMSETSTKMALRDESEIALKVKKRTF